MVTNVDDVDYNVETIKVRVFNVANTVSEVD